MKETIKITGILLEEPLMTPTILGAKVTLK